MKTLTLFIAMVGFSFSTGYGQYIDGEIFVDKNEIPGLVKQLKNNLRGAQKAAILLRIGYGHLYKPGEDKADLDSALQYAQEARAFSAQINNARFINESLLLISMVHMEQKDMPAAKSLLPALHDSNRVKMLISLSQFEFYTKPPTPDDHSLLDSAALHAQAAVKLAAKIKVRHISALQCLETVGRQYSARQLRALAEKQYLFMQEYGDSAHYPSKARFLSNLSRVYSDEGNFYKAVSYGISAEKALNSRSSVSDFALINLNLGSLYTTQEKYEQALVYWGKLLADPNKYRGIVAIYAVANSYCNNLRKLHRTDEILPFLQKFKQQCPIEEDLDRISYHLILANAYKDMKQFEPAEKNFLEAIKYGELSNNSTAVVYFNLGSLYQQFNDHTKALAAFKTAEQGLSNEVLQAHNSSYISQSEAALGNYGAAYHYLVKSKAISDSIFVVSKAKITQELEVQYQTQKKEADLLLKEENIRFLNQNAELMRQEAKLQAAKLTAASLLTQKNEAELKLKKRDIEDLTNNSKLQQAAIEQAAARRKVTVLIIALLGVIIALLIRLFWLKLKSNKVITQKNELLQQLVKDKSWLLKEMHHRVKNNMHTIMNLLEFQSAYLHDDALEAIRNSQSRIFSMSLIHQTLYQADEDAKTIDMAHYISELVSYLRECFNIHHYFHINIDVEHTAFHVEEAVPLGLIINEAVTNSMKYAFKNDQPGEINISLKASGPDEYELLLADNGTGLSEDFDLDNVPSLGFQLIKGLSEQLEASLRIVNENGLKITLSGISMHRTIKIKTMEKELKAQMMA